MKAYRMFGSVSCIALIIMIIAISFTSVPGSARAQDRLVTPTPVSRHLQLEPAADTFRYHITVDQVAVQIALPFPVADFTSSSSDEVFQMATSVQRDPFFELTLMTVPISSTELIDYALGIPPGEPDTSYRQALLRTRQRQGGVVQASYTITIFGQEIPGIANLVPLFAGEEGKEPVVIHEWLTHDRERLWLFRASYAQESQFAASQLGSIVLDIETPYPVEAVASKTEQVPGSFHLVDAPDDLPFPAWWNGDCDVNNFPGSYPLGGIYNGVKACGPLGTYREVDFGVGVHQYEWQCPELSKRYLYLAYGTPPYSAHGKDVVWNYPDTDLEKVPNGTAAKAPKAGSVLSYGPTDPYGHTSIVSSSSVDGNGNGTITVIEQNWSSSGTRTHTVSNWFVQASMSVSGWLYDPAGSGTCPAPSLLDPADNAVLGDRTITFRWNALSGCTFNGYTFRVCTSSDVDNLANCFIDTGEGGTQHTETISGHDYQDLWWGVRAANAPSGASWAVRRFRIEPGSSSCVPNADQIALFVDPNQSGQCVVKGIGEYSNPSAIGLPNDAISSIRVGGSVQGVLCRDDNYGGGCETFTGDDPNLGDNSIGDNQVSSAKVEWRSGGCSPGSDQVALYLDADYSGQCIVKGIGEYANPSAIGLANDAISSIRVGGNVQALLCRDDNYGGGCETFSGDDPNLGDNSIGNDQVSSAKVQVRPPAPDTQKPVLNWVSPTGNGGAVQVGNETITLQVDATDNVAVSRVDFYRWDAVNGRFVTIFRDDTPPYRTVLDCVVLNYGPNQVNAAAYDASGNVDDKHIWIYHTRMVYLPIVLRSRP